MVSTPVFSAPPRIWVSFTIFNASTLEAPEGFFEASDVSDRKTLKIRKGQSVDYVFLAKLLQQAVNAQSTG